MTAKIKGSSDSSQVLLEELRSLKEDLDDFRFYFEEFSASLPLPVLSVNPLGFILDVNQAFETLSGGSKVNILGESVENFFSQTEKILEYQRRVLEGIFVKDQETILRSNKGDIKVSVYFSPRKDREGNMIGYFVGIYDITAFKELQGSLEQKVQERTKELQQRVEELERFRKLTIGRELKMIELKKKLRG